jgi:hypothetical protein
MAGDFASQTFFQISMRFQQIHRLISHRSFPWVQEGAMVSFLKANWLHD